MPGFVIEQLCHVLTHDESIMLRKPDPKNDHNSLVPSSLFYLSIHQQSE
jgi:hypothetical protein